MSKHAPTKPAALSSLIAVAACSMTLVGGNEIQLTPAGVFRGLDGRPTNAPHWFMDAKIADRLIAAANARTAPYVIDYEHQTLRAMQNGQPAPAAGWFKTLEWREGVGLFAVDVEWTAPASAMIETKEYRFISPVIAYDLDGNVTGLLLAALVNNPAIDGMDEAMLAAASAQYTSTHNAALSQELPNMDELLEQLRWMLNLPLASTPADILAQLTKLTDLIKTNTGAGTDGGTAAASCDIVALLGGQYSLIASLGSQVPDPAKFVDIGTATALQSQVAALSGELNATKLNDVIGTALKSGRLLPSMENWAREFGGKDMAALSSYLQAAPVMPAIAGLQSDALKLNPDPSGLNESQAALCQVMGVSAEDFLKTLKAEAKA